MEIIGLASKHDLAYANQIEKLANLLPRGTPAPAAKVSVMRKRAELAVVFARELLQEGQGRHEGTFTCRRSRGSSLEGW